MSFGLSNPAGKKLEAVIFKESQINNILHKVHETFLSYFGNLSTSCVGAGVSKIYKEVGIESIAGKWGYWGNLVAVKYSMYIQLPVS